MAEDRRLFPTPAALLLFCSIVDAASSNSMNKVERSLAFVKSSLFPTPPIVPVVTRGGRFAERLLLEREAEFEGVDLRFEAGVLFDDDIAACFALE